MPAVAFSPDGRAVAAGSQDETVRLWSTATWAVLHVLWGHTDWVRAVAFLSDGATVVSGAEDGTVRLWGTASGRAHRALREASGRQLRVLARGAQFSGQTVMARALWDTMRRRGAVMVGEGGHTAADAGPGMTVAAERSSAPFRCGVDTEDSEDSIEFMD